MLLYYIGIPGSGKSHDLVVSELFPALEAGRKVYTNMPLQMEALAERYPQAWDLVELVEPREDGTPAFALGDDLERMAAWKHLTVKGLGPLLLIDEARRAFPAVGQSEKWKVPDSTKQWFCEHRHDGARVVLATQQYKFVESTIRGNVQKVVWIRNIEHTGVPFLWLVKPLIFRGDYFRRIYNGSEAPTERRKPDLIESRWYRKDVFAVYNSYMRGGGPVKEHGQTLPVGKRAALVALTFGAILAWHFFGPSDSSASPGLAGAPSAVAATAALPPHSSVQPGTTGGGGSVAARPPLSGRAASYGGYVAVDGDTYPLLRIDGASYSVVGLRALGYGVEWLGESHGLLLTYQGQRWLLPASGAWVRL